MSVGLADGDQTQQGDDAEDDQAGPRGCASRRTRAPATARPDARPGRGRPPSRCRPAPGSAHPAIATVALAAADGDLSALGAGCDEQLEFEFALDLLLDAIERLHVAGWSSGR